MLKDIDQTFTKAKPFQDDPYGKRFFMDVSTKTIETAGSL